MKRFKHILFVAEREVDNRAALRRAVTLAENNQATLTVVMVAPKLAAGIGLPDGGPVSKELQEEIVVERKKALDEQVSSLDTVVDIRSKILVGIPFVEIIHEVLAQGHDLVVKVPEELAWTDHLFGSDDMHLLRKCPCPVWLIKKQVKEAYRRILAPVDVTPADSSKDSAAQWTLNIQILEMASSLALAEFAALHIVHVWDAIGESALRGAFLANPNEQIRDYIAQVKRQHEQAFNRLLHELENKLGEEAITYLKPKYHLIKGWARKEIPLMAETINADLVVMGTVARTGIPGFIIGNTAETILNQLNCSVLAVKPPGFKTPLIR
jgi:nucleotide-binding universal stress UspA family protein